MRKAIFLAAMGIVTAPALAQTPLGVFFRWGAFEGASPRKCYAMAAADAPWPGRADRPYASIAVWPERRTGPQVYFRLSGAQRAGSALILRVDGKLFQLVGAGRNAWAPDARADAAIVAAVRTGVNMAVETRSQAGTRIRDHYLLRGAASAIDAAVFACAASRS